MSIKIKDAPTTTVKSTLKIPVGNVGDNNAHTITLSDLKSWMGNTGSGGGGGWRWSEVIEKPKIVQVGEIKTINGETIIGEGDLKVSADEIDWTKVRNRPTKLSEFTNDSGFVVSESLEKNYQTKLVNGVNIKSLNGRSILGEGNITLPEAKSGNGINVADNGTVNMTYMDYLHKADSKEPVIDALVGNAFNRVVYLPDPTVSLDSLTIPTIRRRVEADTCFLVFVGSDKTVVNMPSNVVKTAGFPSQYLNGVNVIMLNLFLDEGKEYWYATLVNGSGSSGSSGGGTVTTIDWSNVTNKPTIPTKTSQLTNDSNFATTAYVDRQATTSAVLYTAQSLTDEQKTQARRNIGAGESNFSGSYKDLADRPTIPTVNDSTITITQGGVRKGTFTTNQSTATTIELDAAGSGGKTYTAGDGIDINGTNTTVINRAKTTVTNSNASVTISEVSANTIYRLTASSLTSLTLTACPDFDLDTVIYFNVSKGNEPTFSFPSDCDVYGDFDNLSVGRHTIVIQNKVIGLASGGIGWDYVSEKPYGIQKMSVPPSVNTINTASATIPYLSPNNIWIFNQTGTITITDMTECLDNTKNWIPARFYINSTLLTTPLVCTITFPQVMKICGKGWTDTLTMTIECEDTACVEIINGYVRVWQ